LGPYAYVNFQQKGAIVIIIHLLKSKWPAQKMSKKLITKAIQSHSCKQKFKEKQIWKKVKKKYDNMSTLY
jgi:hypothetical protein